MIELRKGVLVEVTERPIVLGNIEEAIKQLKEQIAGLQSNLDELEAKKSTALSLKAEIKDGIAKIDG